MAASPKSFLMGAFVLATCLLLMAPATRGLSSSSMQHMQFRIYFQDTLNETDVLVASYRPGNITLISSPFGSVFVVHDNLTATRDPSSALLGSISGLTVSASFDGLTVFNTFTIAINTTSPAVAGIPDNLRRIEGTISIFGLFNVIAPQPLAIIGGTGAFAYAKGFVTIIPLDITTFVQEFALDINLYLP